MFVGRLEFRLFLRSGTAFILAGSPSTPRRAPRPGRRACDNAGSHKLQRGLRVRQRDFTILIGHQQLLECPAQIAVADRNGIVNRRLIGRPGGSPFIYTHPHSLLSGNIPVLSRHIRDG